MDIAFHAVSRVNTVDGAQHAFQPKLLLLYTLRTDYHKLSQLQSRNDLDFRREL